MDLLHNLGLAVDGGLFVLIWIVQLVIYPGFAHYSEDKLAHWHSRYTKRVTVIVFPLMVTQLILGSLELAGDVSWQSVLNISLVIATWLSTFIEFVPLHNKLPSGPDQSAIIALMIRKNWLRTSIWTAIFILSVLGY